MFDCVCISQVCGILSLCTRFLCSHVLDHMLNCAQAQVGGFDV